MCVGGGGEQTNSTASHYLYFSTPFVARCTRPCDPPVGAYKGTAPRSCRSYTRHKEVIRKAEPTRTIGYDDILMGGGGGGGGAYVLHAQQ